MEKELYRKLQIDLAQAIKSKDFQRISELRRLLDISDEQAKYFEQGLTGYPSIDRVYLKYYPEGADDRARNIPFNKTIWDVIEEKILEYYDYPVLEYFGKMFYSEEFKNSCYMWARTFRAMGIEPDEIVPVYGPLTPEIAAMFFGLNMIGACPYFLKLSMSPKDLAIETERAKVAIVYDGMWNDVADEFSKDKFKKVIVSTISSEMPSPKKEIAAFLNKMQAMKNKSRIPNEKKYVWADEAKKIADYYTGNVKVPHKYNRVALVTSSSGTSIGSVVKGVEATNESVLSQVFSTSYSDIPYGPGLKVLNHFPPTAATSMNSLFLSPIYCGATVTIDPRVSANAFYNQIMKLKPNFIINTSSMWEMFFARVDREMKAGKKFDFSFAKGWMIGGEGTSVKSLKRMNEIMQKCNGTRLYGGYGLSEVFSGICIDRIDIDCDYSRPIVCVGVPQVGMVVRIVDKDGKELTYNQRGFLEVESTAAMNGYHNKPELTKRVKTGDEIKTGDMVEISDKGLMYVWGRADNHIITKDELELYLFDIEVLLRKNDFIFDALVLAKPTIDNKYNLVAHILWDGDYSYDEKKEFICKLNEQLNQFLPPEVSVSGFAEHNEYLPISPTSLKKDRNGMLAQNDGYIQVSDNQLYSVEFEVDKDGMCSKKYVPFDLNKTGKERKKAV